MHRISHGGFVKREVRVGVLASGRGSNFEALIKAAAGHKLGGSVVCLGTDNANAGALEIAGEHHVTTLVVSEIARRGHLSTEHEQQLSDFMRQNNVDLVCLAGFMRIIRGPLLQAYPRAILNIHPSLLPSFPGLDAAGQAVQHGVRIAGCTVHFVDSGIDSGPILLQAAVPVHSDDTADSLAARILEQEHRLYPEAVLLWASGRVRFDGSPEEHRVSIPQPPEVPLGIADKEATS